MTNGGQKALTQRFVFVGISAFLLGTLAVAVFRFLAGAFASGDTPVIIIGGSVDLNTDGSKNWQPDTTPGTYYAPAGGVIGTISIKNPHESQVVDVQTLGNPWVVTIVSEQGNAVQVTQNAGDPKKIHVAPIVGTFTQSTPPTNLKYHHGGACPGGGGCDKLLTVAVAVNGIPLGTINCTDTAAISGHCKVVFKEK